VRRLLLAGAALGVVNALVAVLVLEVVWSLTPDSFGWFAYAPLQPNTVLDVYRPFPWEWVALPAVLLPLNAVAVLLLARRLAARV
jgi:hypothetical protein